MCSRDTNLSRVAVDGRLTLNATVTVPVVLQLLPIIQYGVLRLIGRAAISSYIECALLAEDYVSKASAACACTCVHFNTIHVLPYAIFGDGFDRPKFTVLLQFVRELETAKKIARIM